MEKLWAEAGEWVRGEPALVIMRGAALDDEYGVTWETTEVLHDVPLADPGEWEAELKSLGYRRISNCETSQTYYGVAFDVEEV